MRRQSRNVALFVIGLLVSWLIFSGCGCLKSKTEAKLDNALDAIACAAYATTNVAPAIVKRVEDGNKRLDADHVFWLNLGKQLAPYCVTAAALGVWLLRERAHRLERKDWNNYDEETSRIIGSHRRKLARSGRKRGH